MQLIDWTSQLVYRHQHWTTDLVQRAINTSHRVACVAAVNGEGEGERERGRKMGFWELGTRERLLQRPPFFHLRPLIF